jgi:hypothetical protein
VWSLSSSVDSSQKNFLINSDFVLPEISVIT